MKRNLFVWKLVRFFFLSVEFVSTGMFSSIIFLIIIFILFIFYITGFLDMSLSLSPSLIFSVIISIFLCFCSNIVGYFSSSSSGKLILFSAEIMSLLKFKVVNNLILIFSYFFKCPLFKSSTYKLYLSLAL